MFESILKLLSKISQRHSFHKLITVHYSLCRNLAILETHWQCWHFWAFFVLEIPKYTANKVKFVIKIHKICR